MKGDSRAVTVTDAGDWLFDVIVAPRSRSIWPTGAPAAIT
jgi:hypothetical protein